MGCIAEEMEQAKHTTPIMSTYNTFNVLYAWRYTPHADSCTYTGKENRKLDQVYWPKVRYSDYD